MAHELRSPLTGVKGFVQALLNRWDKLSDDQKKLMLDTVNADSDRLSRLIAELLDVARIDTGRLQLLPRGPPTSACWWAGSSSRSRAGTARPIDLTVDGRTCPTCCADPDKFTQVVTNLVENAVRHGEGDVRSRSSTAHRRATEACGCDRGRGPGGGHPARSARRVFTKFWTGGARGGSGLGLYIVNGLVARPRRAPSRSTTRPSGGARSR